MAGSTSVVIATYPSRSAADVARGVLEAEGIDADIITDDAGGLHPELAMNQGVNVVVHQSEARHARSILHLEEGPSPWRSHGRLTKLVAGVLAFMVLAAVVVSVVQSF